MKVQDVMTRDVAACGTETDLAAAAMVMWHRDCGAVPVVDDERSVIGMITDRDICMSLVLGRRLASEVKVGEVMSKNVRSCAPVDDIRDALRIMQEVKEQTGNRVWTAKRVNQKEQNPVWFDRLLSRVRERIEGSFNELQNTGRNLERLLAKTVIGLTTRVIAKVTSYTLKQLLRNSFGLDVQTFQVADA